MKKVLIFAMLAVTAGLLFSCGDDDSETGEEVWERIVAGSSSDSSAPSSSSLAPNSDSFVPSSSSLAPSSVSPVRSSSSLTPSSSSPARSSSSSVRSSSSLAASSGSGICNITSGYCLYSGPNECWPMPTDDCCEYGTVVANQSACSSTAVKYCNWGTCVGGNLWECSGGGGCYAITTRDTEANCIRDNGTVVDCCPTDARPPSASYPVCSIVSSSSLAPPISSSVAPSSNSSVPSSNSLAYSGKGNNISSYRTVEIGTQTWMAENLDYVVEGSKCYNNDPARCTTYGSLYNWSTAMAFPSSCTSTSCSSQINSPHRGICPSGWHIPSDAEWTTLMNFVGGDNAGIKLRATSDWLGCGPSGSGSLCGEDTFGFSALPGGGGFSGYFAGVVGSYGYWWSATEFDADFAYNRFRFYLNSNDMVRSEDVKSNLKSVRCVKD